MVKIHNAPKMDGVSKMYPVRYMDARGWFSQAWTEPELIAIGFREGFIQCNIAYSKHGVLRGMHRQDQTKLVQVLSGAIYDVVLNPETGEWQGYHLVEGECLYVPPEYAHGYLVTADTAVVQYFVDKPYNKEQEENFAWNGYEINWPLTLIPILSAKDLA